MIHKMTPLSMAEAKNIAEGIEECKEPVKFLKKFVKIKNEDALKLKAELKGLDLMKVKDFHIAKIIDVLPEDNSDLNKIFVDVSLDENEANKILEVVKKYK